MLPLQFVFNKPPFDIQGVEVCPFQDRRGRLVQYNIVASGQTLNEQSIVGVIPAEQGWTFAEGQAQALKEELHLH